MNGKLTSKILLFLLFAFLLSSCMGRPTTVVRSLPDSVETAPADAQETQFEIDPTSAPTPVKEDPTAEPVVSSEGLEDAKQTAEAYFTAVSEGRSEEAADLLSNFGLMVAELTRGDAAEYLQSQKIDGVQWSDLDVLDTQEFDENTQLVHVVYKESSKGKDEAGEEITVEQTRDELWPMRLESGKWLYNWNNIIDFRTLDAPAQTTNGITIMPSQLNRYSDRIQLLMLLQNRTNDVVVFGQVNETLGRFHFGDEEVVAEKTQWILNPQRSVADAELVAKGLYHDMPDTIDIRTWNNYNVEPWFVFQLN